jgi:hypothetical protein
LKERRKGGQEEKRVRESEEKRRTNENKVALHA